MIATTRRLSLFILAVVLSLAPAPAGAQDRPSVGTQPDKRSASTQPDKRSAPKKVITVEGITEYRLDNGLQVLLFPDPSKPTVTVNVTYLVGSRHEGRGEAGMAHLLEHMVFKGTPTYENIWGALEDHGASFNGSTWVDRTNYFETLPASNENLEFALHMEADRMVNSFISAEELAREMTVVRNEFERGENNPSGILSERMTSAAYLWHNYGKSTIGNRSDIERVPAENLKRFYQRYYQPDNAVLVVAGKFDVERTLTLIQDYFGRIPRPTRVLEATYTEEPPQDGPRFVTLERVGDVAAAGLVYHIPAGSHPDYPAVSILEDVLTSQPSGRLYKALVETGKAASVGGAAFSWAEPGIVQIMAQVRLDQDARAVLDVMTRIVETVGAGEISDEEVERSRTRMLKNIKMALTDSGRIGIQLSEFAALGDWRMFFIHRDRLKEVTPDDVKRAASTYLVASNRTAGLFIPSKETPTRSTVPPAPDVQQIVSGYKGSETIETGEAFVATPDNIEKRTTRETLENGIQIALLPKETRGDAVRASLIFRFGTEKDMVGHTTALGMIPRMLMRGTRTKTYQQLQDEIDKLQSRINVFGGAGQVIVSIESDREHVVDAINLVAEVMKEPALSQDEFEVLKRESLAAQERGLSDPQALGFNALSRAMNPWPKDSIHYVETLQEQIDKTRAVEIDDLRDLYRRFYGAGNLDVGVVGDFDPAAVKSMVNRHFGSWKSPSPYKRVEHPYRPVSADSAVIHTPDKKMAMVAAGTVFEMRDDDPDYPALDFAGYVLGESAKSRLLNRLRHQGGLSYGARGSLSADSEDERASLMGFAICAPENAVKAQEALREELTKWIAEGVTEEELSEGKVAFAKRFENQLANDRSVVNLLTSGLEIHRTLVYHDALMKRVASLTREEIAAALKKHLGSLEMFEVKAGDLAAKDARPESPPATGSPQGDGAEGG